MKRLLAYLKPHKWTMAAATLLVLFIIVVELYRPIIIGDAIDDYINGYYHPYEVSSQDAPGAVPFQGSMAHKSGGGAFCRTGKPFVLVSAVPVSGHLLYGGRPLLGTVPPAGRGG